MEHFTARLMLRHKLCSLFRIAIESYQFGLTLDLPIGSCCRVHLLPWDPASIHQHCCPIKCCLILMNHPYSISISAKNVLGARNLERSYDVVSTLRTRYKTAGRRQIFLFHARPRPNKYFLIILKRPNQFKFPVFHVL